MDISAKSDRRINRMDSKGEEKNVLSESCYILTKYRIQVINSAEVDEEFATVSKVSDIGDEVRSTLSDHDYHIGPKALGKCYENCRFFIHNS